MKRLNSIKHVSRKDLKEDIIFFEGLIDDFTNRNLGTLQFMMHTQTMIKRVLRITDSASRVMDMRHLEYKLDKFILMDKSLDTDVDKLRVRDIADDVIKGMYSEYVKL